MEEGRASSASRASAAARAERTQSGTPTPSKALPTRANRGVPGGEAAGLGDAVEMAEGVLGHRAGVAGDVDQQGVAGGADQLGQLAAGDPLQLVVVALEEVGAGRSAEEGPQQGRCRPGRGGGT